MVTSYIRGHKSYFKNGKWYYTESNEEVINDNIGCASCLLLPIKEGYDACLGYIEGVLHACCGHNVEPSYAVFENKESYSKCKTKFDRVEIN